MIKPDEECGTIQTIIACEPDAHGQAALLLVESLIHVLIERSVINLADAVDALTTAAEVEQDVGFALSDSPATPTKSLTLLESIRRSLELDLCQK